MSESLSIRRIPLKQAEIAIRRFNDVAIPQHLSLLQNHRSNIEKNLALGDWKKTKKEEINALRVIKQIKNLLLEMEALREKVRDEDLEVFDARMEEGKQKALNAMKEYLELQVNSPTSNLRWQGQSANEEDNELLEITAEIGQTQVYQSSIPHIKSEFEAEEHLLAQRQSCLEELQNVQHEIRDVNSMFHTVRAMTQEQAESVQIIADNAEEALENVQIGESNLRKALTYKKAMYPVIGAIMGTCLGGPIGLVAGLKAGSLAAVGCGVLGFTGGTALTSKPAIMQGNIEEVQMSTCETNTQEELEWDKKDD